MCSQVKSWTKHGSPNQSQRKETVALSLSGATWLYKQTAVNQVIEMNWAEPVLGRQR